MPCEDSNTGNVHPEGDGKISWHRSDIIRCLPKYMHGIMGEKKVFKGQFSLKIVAWIHYKKPRA